MQGFAKAVGNGQLAVGEIVAELMDEGLPALLEFSRNEILLRIRVRSLILPF